MNTQWFGVELTELLFSGEVSYLYEYNKLSIATNMPFQNVTKGAAPSFRQIVYTIFGDMLEYSNKQNDFPYEIVNSNEERLQQTRVSYETTCSIWFMLLFANYENYSSY